MFFPNPLTNNVLSFQIDEELEEVLVEITDIKGVMVYQQKITSTNNQVNLADLSGGIYQVTMTTPSSRTTENLVINN